MNINDYTELVRKAKGGDENAFASIYTESKRLIYATCYGVLNNEQDAEDAMQETYITVFNELPNLTDESRFLGWIKTTAFRKSIDIYRRRKDNPSYEDALASDEALDGDDDLETLPDSYIIEKTRRDILQGIMRNGLSDVQYHTILLYYYDELSISDIASVMGCPEETVKSRLKTSRIKIKSGIKEYEDKNNDKFLAAGLPFLGKFFSSVASDLVVPDVDVLPSDSVHPDDPDTPRPDSPDQQTPGNESGSSAASHSAAAATSSSSVLKTVIICLAVMFGIASVTGIAILVSTAINAQNSGYERDEDDDEEDEKEIEETTSAPAEATEVEMTHEELRAVTPTESEPSETSEVPLKTASDYVTDIRENYEYMEGPDEWETYHVPYVLIESDYANEINAEIAAVMDSYAYELEQYGYCSYYSTSYIAFLTDEGILSLVFRQNLDTDDQCYYTVYNIDVNTGEKVDNAALAATAGVEDITTAAKAAVQAYLNYSFAGYLTISDYQVTYVSEDLFMSESDANSMLVNNLSESRLNDDMQIGLTSEGTMFFISTIDTIGGSGFYEGIYDADGNPLYLREEWVN